MQLRARLGLALLARVELLGVHALDAAELVAQLARLGFAALEPRLHVVEALLGAVLVGLQRVDQLLGLFQLALQVVALSPRSASSRSNVRLLSLASISCLSREVT